MGLFYYLRNGRRMLINLRTHPNKQRKYPFSSARQHARAARQYMATTRGGFEIMQTRRGA